jgi:PhzF family phenazine biosynthesis protein
MPVPYYHVDSFAEELFAGNPAGVCIFPAFPADAIMQQIAAENRHSETAFVVSRPDGDFDLRWFTPVAEDDLCGHATLAAAYVLSLRGHACWPVRFHTVTALLTVHRDEELFEMDFPFMPAMACEEPAGLLSALGLRKGVVLRSSRDFLVVADSAKTVRDLKPDMRGLLQLDMGTAGAIVTAAGDNDIDYVCRFFLPSMGIDEDPVTGSIQCSLAPYWAERSGEQTFQVQQMSRRGGRMRCRTAGDRVRIAGQARLYLQGAIEL